MGARRPASHFLPVGSRTRIDVAKTNVVVAKHNHGDFMPTNSIYDVLQESIWTLCVFLCSITVFACTPSKGITKGKKILKH
jgi:hypothetical protein